MEVLYTFYRDPIFAILFIVILVLLIATSHYLWGIYFKNKQNAQIQKFIKQFEGEKSNFSHLKDEERLFLADGFFKIQNYKKALDIYLELHIDSAEFFYKIAYAKYKLGLWGDSVKFLEFCLKSNPRYEKSLKLLKYIYFRQFDFEKTLEVAYCLNVLKDCNEEIDFLKKYSKNPFLPDKKLSFSEIKIPEKFKISIVFECKSCDFVNMDDFFYCPNCFDFKTSKAELRIKNV